MRFRVALVLALFSSVSVAAEWLALTEEGATIQQLLDSSSVVPVGGSSRNIKAWIKFKYTTARKVPPGGENAGKDYFEALTLYHINCDSRTIGTVQQILYAKNGEVLHTSSSAFPAMEDVAPETMGESALDSACLLHELKTIKP